jgi:hypothetical protein
MKGAPAAARAVLEPVREQVAVDARARLALSAFAVTSEGHT